MTNLVAMILVIFAIVIGIGACWAIAANGAVAPDSTDTFGDAPPADTVYQSAASSEIAVATMPVLAISFFIVICVILVASFAWLWKTGKSKASKY